MTRDELEMTDESRSFFRFRFESKNEFGAKFEFDFKFDFEFELTAVAATVATVEAVDEQLLLKSSSKSRSIQD